MNNTLNILEKYLMQPFVEICTGLASLETRWNVPEADVDKLRLFHNELETLSTTNHFSEVRRLFEQFINVRLEPFRSLALKS